jgi:Ca2+-binding RTX toxin-like protein
LAYDTTTGMNSLFIYGTTAANTIVLTGSNNAVTVKINGVSKGTFAVPTGGRIVVDGLAGNDTITVASTITVSAWLYGGAGNDTITAGGGPSYLFGGDGDDTLTGGSGRSILIGGAGKDALTSGDGEAVLIGGTTNYDADKTTLAAILGKWNDTSDYAARAASLVNYYLNASTVKDDSAIDTLIGSTTASHDLFFQKLGSDTISNNDSSEIVVPIGV